MCIFLFFELQDNHGHFKKRIAYLIANGAGLAYQIFGEPAPSSWSWEDNPEGVDADGPHLSIGGIRLEILGYQNTTEKVHQRPYVQHTGKSIPDEKNYLHPAATAVINLGEFTCQMYLDNPSLQRNIINLPSLKVVVIPGSMPRGMMLQPARTVLATNPVMFVDLHSVYQSAEEMRPSFHDSYCPKEHLLQMTPKDRLNQFEKAESKMQTCTEVCDWLSLGLSGDQALRMMARNGLTHFLSSLCQAQNLGVAFFIDDTGE